VSTTNGTSSADSETRAVMSCFTGTVEDWMGLVKTLVAMANTAGGRILLERVECSSAELESARLDDKVNRYAGPRVRGLATCARGAGTVEILVPESESMPHVFKFDLADPGRPGSAHFHSGQVWVRHGSRNEPATPEDLQRILRRRMVTTLEDLRERVLQADEPLALREGEGIPVRFSDEPGAVAVVPDVDQTYPFTARTLGQALGKGQNWAAAAIECLEMKGKPELWFGSKGAAGYAVQRYSERAAEILRARLREDPAWNPFAELRGKGRRPARRRRPASR